MDSYLQFYKQQLNLSNATLIRIVHEDAIVAIVYKVILPTGGNFILKIAANTQDYLREVYFLNLFCNKLLVPKIIKVVPPEKARNGAILMECLSGYLLSKDNWTVSIAKDIGKQLGLLHAHRTDGFGDLVKPNELTHDSIIPFSEKFEEGIAECTGHFSQNFLAKLKTYFDKHISLLETVDGPCTIHRDFRPGNIIINNGKLQGIIDWASSRSSFAEEDFCSLVSEGWLEDKAMKQPFLSGYSSVRPVPNYERLLTFLQFNKAVATIGFTLKRDTWNTTSANLYQKHFQFLSSISF